MHGIIKCQHQGQMSESFPTAAFLSISGGLQDAYTYVFRGKVFANAQTGNIVLLSQTSVSVIGCRAHTTLFRWQHLQ